MKRKRTSTKQSSKKKTQAKAPKKTQSASSSPKEPASPENRVSSAPASTELSSTALSPVVPAAYILTKEKVLSVMRTFIKNQMEVRARQMEEPIESDSLYSDEQITYLAQHWIGSYPELQNEVGVLPILDITSPARDLNRAGNTYFKAVEDPIYDEISRHPAYQNIAPDMSIKLPDPSKMSVEDKLIADERAARELYLRDIANQMVSMQLKPGNMVKIYLESVLEAQDHSFLKNIHKNFLPINAENFHQECQQIILPIGNRNNNHYTVAVIHFSQNAQGRKCAHIDYYNSLGPDLPETYRNQLIEYFMGKGYETDYYCISSRERPDQIGEEHNCGNFVICKSLDMALENKGIREQNPHLGPVFLSQLNSSNYERVFIHLRILNAFLLQSAGFQAPIAPDLIEDFRRKLNGGAPLLCEAFIDTLKLAEDVLSEIGDDHSEGLAQLSQQTTDKVEQAVAGLKLAKVKEELNGKLQAKLALSEPSEKDKAQIQALLDVIGLVESHAAALKQQLQTSSPLTPRTRSNSVTTVDKDQSMFKDFMAGISALDYKKIAIYGGLGSLALFMGWPYAILGYLKLAALLPANPIYTIVGSALCFSVIQYVTHRIAPEENAAPSMPSPSLPRAILSQEEQPSEAKDPLSPVMHSALEQALGSAYTPYKQIHASLNQGNQADQSTTVIPKATAKNQAMSALRDKVSASTASKSPEKSDPASSAPEPLSDRAKGRKPRIPISRSCSSLPK